MLLFWWSLSVSVWFSFPMSWCVWSLLHFKGWICLASYQGSVIHSEDSPSISPFGFVAKQFGCSLVNMSQVVTLHATRDYTELASQSITFPFIFCLSSIPPSLMWLVLSSFLVVWLDEGGIIYSSAVAYTCIPPLWYCISMVTMATSC